VPKSKTSIVVNKVRIFSPLKSKHHVGGRKSGKPAHQMATSKLFELLAVNELGRDLQKVIYVLQRRGFTNSEIQSRRGQKTDG